MSAIWTTAAGVIGTAVTNQEYQYQLVAFDTQSQPVSFKIISGSLPSNISLYSNGLIQGTALPMPDDQLNTSIDNPYNAVNTRTFVVRATTQDNQISDRTFTLWTRGIDSVVLSPTSGNLGSYLSGSFVNVQLSTLNPIANSNIVYSTTAISTLPPGVNLSTTTGAITGYILPSFYSLSPNVIAFDMSAWGQYPFDGIDENKVYQFSITAQNDLQYWNRDTENYSLYSYSRKNLTADNTILTADNATSFFTADLSNQYSPILLTNAGFIGNTRIDDNYRFKFEAIDFNSDDLSYNLVSGTLPSGISLLSNIGYLSGSITSSNLGYTDYSFSINAYKTNDPEFVSETKSYTLRVLGTTNQSVVWQTASNLGSIYTGEISDLSISAISASGRSLYYRLSQDSVGSLPAGLALQPDGLIVGRPSWNVLDSSQEKLYTFSVEAYDSSSLDYGSKQFSFRLIRRTKKPYQNLYLQLIPDRAQRDIYDLAVTNPATIPESALYRSTDKWFGRNTDRTLLFLAGINPQNIADYSNAIQLNHYWKTLRFGEIKSARATDENINTIYEVIYIEILEDNVNSQGFGPNLSLTWPTNQQNISQVYPNTFNNMSTRILNDIGYLDKGVLPKWMTSRQTNGTVLGFTRALVLAYLKPGQSEEIAFRLSKSNIDFNQIDFTVDRYLWDNVLSDNFIITPLPDVGTITANNQSNIVTGLSTTFTANLSSGASIFVSGNPIGVIDTIGNATSLVLTANSLSNVTNQSYTFNNVFIANNYTLATGNISANTQSNIVTGITGNIVGTGLITFINSSYYITGIGTDFANELTAGSNLVVAGILQGTVDRIFSNANIKADISLLMPSFVNVAFSTNLTSTIFNREIKLGDSIKVGSTVIGTVANILSNTSLILSANSTTNISNQQFYHINSDPVSYPTLGDQYIKFPNVNILT